ncbi:hypothetical protein PG993_000675 [Apiospora rasikravindrae]|uniref:Uncharacterized protein n=1 Tax=Apiospora rasikravindrae TaxID=990691 RepID=A0ABR1U977_9PEZI
MLLETLDTNDPFRRRQEDPNFTFTRDSKVCASRRRASWPNLKPLKRTSTLEPIEGLVHLKRLRAVLQPQPQGRRNALILGCKAIARLVWRRRRWTTFSGTTEAVTIPTLVIGVEFNSASPGKIDPLRSNRQSLREIFEVVRDALVEEGITEYGLEVTLLGLLPTAFVKAGDGLLGQVTAVICNERSI